MNKTASTFLTTMQNELLSAGTSHQRLSSSGLSSALGRLSDSFAAANHWVNSIQAVQIPSEWEDTEYRRAAMEATVESMIAWQVRINREQRGMKQMELAALMGTKQSAVSRLEDTEGADVKVSTLVKAAHAFDCALLVRFVDFTEFAAQSSDVHPDRLYAASFTSGAGETSLVSHAVKTPHGSKLSAA